MRKSPRIECKNRLAWSQQPTTGNESINKIFFSTERWFNEVPYLNRFAPIYRNQHGRLDWQVTIKCLADRLAGPLELIFQESDAPYCNEYSVTQMPYNYERKGKSRFIPPNYRNSNYWMHFLKLQRLSLPTFAWSKILLDNASCPCRKDFYMGWWKRVPSKVSRGQKDTDDLAERYLPKGFDRNGLLILGESNYCITQDSKPMKAVWTSKYIRGAETNSSMRNSTILFVVAVLILAWFGSETFTAQQICVTSCIDLSGMPVWEQASSVAILPIILVLGGIRVMKTEKMNKGSQFQA